MSECKKLIEVAMPIREISVESVRDKSIRHGHISTLHLWWARRPLPVSRAIVFASLVPDPLDENCPQAFRDDVEIVLGFKNNLGDPYKPYKDIPFTTAIDEMEDNLRNRLLMFIGKFSDIYSENEKTGKITPAKDLLSDSSLIKWDNKNNNNIINKARKLIWVAHNSSSSKTALELIQDFENHLLVIKKAEQKLYSIIDRHIETEEVKAKQKELDNAIDSFLNKMPNVFDPFAGGGAIPLEASRLGCRSFANDINPVAHIIEKCSLEFPQKYGKQIIYSKEEFIRIYGEKEFNDNTDLEKIIEKGEETGVKIPNRLSYDVEYFSRKLLKITEEEIGHLYPPDEKGNKPIAYYWARVATCSNPTCKAEVPLLRQFYLVNKPNRKIYLNPIINGKNITFKIEKGDCDIEGWNHRGNLKCPICKNVTNVNEIKVQSKNNTLKSKLLAVVYEGHNSKEYRIPIKNQLEILSQNGFEIDYPNEKMQRNSAGGDTFSWGITKWSQLFSNRQLYAMQTFIKNFQFIISEIETNDKTYSNAIATYLGVFINRLSSRNNSFCIWNSKRETLEHPFGRQAIPMILDYPESNPFSESGGGGLNQLDWITRYRESESNNPFPSYCQNSSSGEKEQFPENYITATVTDPPYYDAIAYADLSDFFYLWLKRTLGKLYPIIFSTPQTPKSEECTALKHHHNGDAEKAKQHFENKLLEIFKAIEHQTSDIVSIMFAHQSTEAWTTLCNSILGANMNITGSWSNDTEMQGALKTNKAFLTSSVTVACKPSTKTGTGYFKDVKKNIEKNVENAVEELYKLGFRGPDLLTACFGNAVSEFGKYEKVEKTDGSDVMVKELLDLTKEIAFNSLLKGFAGDDFTKFYIGWLQLFGFTESEFDDAAKFSRVGLSINVSELFSENILLRNGNKQTLADYKTRNETDKNLGNKTNSKLIDRVHKAMFLYKGNVRRNLLVYIKDYAASPENPFWRVITSLCEVLPAGSEDHKIVMSMNIDKDILIRECKQIKDLEAEQTKLEI